MRYAVLVYQASIANVFQVDNLNMLNCGRNAKRLLQYDFHSCELFAQGLAAAGIVVRTACCNLAGDIINARWSEDLDSAPFSARFHPVRAH